MNLQDRLHLMREWDADFSIVSGISHQSKALSVVKTGAGEVLETVRIAQSAGLTLVEFVDQTYIGSNLLSVTSIFASADLYKSAKLMPWRHFKLDLSRNYNDQRPGTLQGKTEALVAQRQVGNDCETIIDVGVLMGTPELVRSYPEKRHLLIEPLFEYFPIIHRAYRGRNYKLVMAAASSVSGEIELNVPSLSSAGLPNSAVAAKPGDKNVRRVPCIALDDYLDDYPEQGPFLLKLDVDGHEYEIMGGASKVLRRAEIVVIESKSYNMLIYGDFLKEYGFQLVNLVDHAYYYDRWYQCDVIYRRIN